MRTFLQVENISKSYGDLKLFEGLSFCINEGQKSALIARNGAGKSSLLEILAGNDSSDSGRIVRLKDISIGYLQQEPLFNEEDTVLQAVWSQSASMTQAVLDYERALNSEDKLDLEIAINKMDSLNAWAFESRIKQVLYPLKLYAFEQKVGTLSGGQRKRLALAALLIHDHDLLIMDEPTNHLDVEMIEWLEAYLSKSKSTVFMVTHDRYFLDRVCNEIFELESDRIEKYSGNYTQYLEKREQRMALRDLEISRARNLLRTEAEWMRRMPQARATKAKYRIDAFYKLQEKAKNRIEERQVQFNVGVSRLGNKTIECYNIGKSIGNKVLIEDFSYKFARYERVGIVGANGCGKTTLLNMITGFLSPDHGHVEMGETVSLGYYQQKGIEIRHDQRVIDVIKEVAEVITLGDGKVMTVSQFLNFFLFPPKSQYAPVSKLSGGEKRRLYLMMVLIKNPNFLILDEPTNDLDIVTLQILENYLETFRGCLLIASHDRYFMDKIVDHLFVFDGKGHINDFPGNYTEYRAVTEMQTEETEKPVSTKSSPSKPSVSKPAPTRKKLSWKDEQELKAIEKEIDELTSLKDEIESALASGNLTSQELNEKIVLHGEITARLEMKNERWLELEMLKEL